MKSLNHNHLAYYISLLCAAVICSCSTDDTSGEQPSTAPVAVAFTTQLSSGIRSGETNAARTGATTRSLITSENIKSKEIGLFGFNENKADLFVNEKLSWDTDAWKYDNLRYWNSQTTYTFSAYAPRVTDSDIEYSGFSSVTGDKTFTIKNIHQWQDADNGFDLLLADPTNITNKPASTFYDVTDGYKKVDLNFQHQLALLTINASVLKEVWITDISLGSSDGAVQVPCKDVAKLAQFSFNLNTQTASVTNPDLANSASLPLTTGNLHITKEYIGGKKVAQVLIVPFTTSPENNLSVGVTYTKQEGGTPITLWAPITGLTKFEAGKSYTLNLEIQDETSITVTMQVGFRTWTNVGNDSTPLYNW